MNFKGDARGLTALDISLAAQELLVDEATIHALIDVESSGHGFGPDGRPTILFEPHIFHRELLKLSPTPKNREKLNRAVADGLAYLRWKTKPYPKTQAERYAQLERAIIIDTNAAIRSTSWGLAQIMGFNYAACGFDDVQSFVEAMKRSEGDQLLAMVVFIRKKSLALPLREKDWVKFARGYNGSGQAERYGSLLSQAYSKYFKPEAIDGSTRSI